MTEIMIQKLVAEWSERWAWVGGADAKADLAARILELIAHRDKRIVRLRRDELDAARAKVQAADGHAVTPRTAALLLRTLGEMLISLTHETASGSRLALARCVLDRALAEIEGVK